MNRSKIEHSFTTFGAMFIIFTQPPVTAQPGKGPLDNPATRQNLEANLIGFTLHNFQDNIETIPNPVNQAIFLVHSIGPQLLEGRNGLAQLVQNQFGPLVILDVGGMNDHLQQITDRINYNMTFAAFDLFAGIVASFSAGFGGFDTLAVDHSCARIYGPSSFETLLLAQDTVNPLPSPIHCPFAVVIVDTVVVGVLFGQILPLATSSGHIEDGVHHLPQIQFHGSTGTPTVQGQQRFY